MCAYQCPLQHVQINTLVLCRFVDACQTEINDSNATVFRFPNKKKIRCCEVAVNDMVAMHCSHNAANSNGQLPQIIYAAIRSIGSFLHDVIFHCDTVLQVFHIDYVGIRVDIVYGWAAYAYKNDMLVLWQQKAIDISAIQLYLN